VASIAKSCPEHYANISLGDFALRISAYWLLTVSNRLTHPIGVRALLLLGGLSALFPRILTVIRVRQEVGGHAQLEHETADTSGGTPPVRCSRLSHAG
jgi:hypothetical protein